MTVNNEKLVQLYQETSDKKSKDIIFKKIYKKNYGLIYTICGSYIKNNKETNKVDVSELYQELSCALLASMNHFKNDKEVKFSSYFTGIAYNHLSNFMRDNYTKYKNEISSGSSDGIDWYSTTMHDDGEIEDIDNNSFRDNIRLCIDKIVFRDEKHKFIFQCRHGLNRYKRCMTCKEIASIVNLTQQRVSIICKNYEAKLKKIVEKEISSGRLSIEDLGLESRV